MLRRLKAFNAAAFTFLSKMTSVAMAIMETLAVTPCQLPSISLGFSPTVSANFNARFSGLRLRSISLLSSASGVRTLKCSALSSSPSLVDQSVKFREASKNGNLVPLYRSIFSDHLTPVIAYRCLVKEDDRDAPSFLFESVEPGLQASSIKAFVIHWVRLDQYSSVDEAYNDGMKQLETLVSRVHDIDPPKLPAGSIKLHTRQFGPKVEISSMTSDACKEAVLLAKEHILAGDIFQTVLSQRFERRTFADPF